MRQVAFSQLLDELARHACPFRSLCDSSIDAISVEPSTLDIEEQSLRAIFIAALSCPYPSMKYQGSLIVKEYGPIWPLGCTANC